MVMVEQVVLRVRRVAGDMVVEGLGVSLPAPVLRKIARMLRRMFWFWKTHNLILANMYRTEQLSFGPRGCTRIWRVGKRMARARTAWRSPRGRGEWWLGR